MIDFALMSVNFLILLIGGYFIGKQYVAGALQRQRAFEKLSHEALERQQQDLEKQKKNVHAQERRQQTEYQDLSSKIAQWRHAVVLQAERRATLQQEVEHALQERHEQYVREQKQIKLYAQAMPHIMGKAEEDLRKLFASQAAQTSYMRPIMQYMEHEYESHS